MDGDIPRRAKSAAEPSLTVNGIGEHNVSRGDGVEKNGKRARDAEDEVDSQGSTKKRRPESNLPQDDIPVAKRGKITDKSPADDELVILDDPTDGAIVIEDD